MRGESDDLPVTVAVIVVASGWFVLNGINAYPRDLSSLPLLVDPLYYVGSLFAHSGVSHFLMNVYFFIPAGIVLTYLTGNKEVLGVVVAAHLPAAFIGGIVGAGAIGISAAAYGLLAAMLVHSTWLAGRSYTGAVRVASTIGVFVVAGFALFISTGGAFSAYSAPVTGFVIGGAFESWRVIRGFGYEKPESEKIISDSFQTPSFRTRWENIANNKEEAEKLEEMYSGSKASRDDTRSGSGGRTRKK